MGEVMKIEEGQWWLTRGGAIRKVIAVDPADYDGPYTVYAISDPWSFDIFTCEGRFLSTGEEHDSDLVKHLPDCTGFDWVPETFPQYYRHKDKFLDGTAYIERTSATSMVFVAKLGSRSSVWGWGQFDNERVETGIWIQITEAEALAMLDTSDQTPAERCAMCNSEAIPGTGGCRECTEYAMACVGAPVESPDDWVVQDRVEARHRIDQAWWEHPDQPFDDITWAWWTVDSAGTAAGRKHGFRASDGQMLHLRCRRKDLPPLPEEKKTRTVKVSEYIVGKSYQDMVVVWRTVTPRDWPIVHETGNTREINVPVCKST